MTNLTTAQRQEANRTSTVAQNRIVSRNRPPKVGSVEQLSLLEKFAPLYEATPYWSIDPVPLGESPPKQQRYRLSLTHGRLTKSIPVQLSPEDADLLFGVVRELDYDWQLDLDKTGQIVDDEARSALKLLVSCFLGGAV